MSALNQLVVNDKIPEIESRKRLAELFDEHHTKNSTMVLAVLENGRLEISMHKGGPLVAALVIDSLIQSEPETAIFLAKILQSRGKQ